MNIECVLWYKLLAFEVIRSIMHKQPVFKQLYQEISQQAESASADNNTNFIVVQLLNAICNFVQRTLRENQGTTSTLSIQQYLKRENRLDVLLDRPSPVATIEECIALALETISVIVTSMSILADIHKLDSEEEEEISDEEALRIKHNREVRSHMMMRQIDYHCYDDHYH